LEKYRQASNAAMNLNIDGRISSYQHHIADTFNSYFLSVAIKVKSIIIVGNNNNNNNISHTQNKYNPNTKNN
jgi:hypothetical protein